MPSGFSGKANNFMGYFLPHPADYGLCTCICSAAKNLRRIILTCTSKAMQWIYEFKAHTSLVKSTRPKQQAPLHSCETFVTSNARSRPVSRKSTVTTGSSIPDRGCVPELWTVHQQTPQHPQLRGSRVG